MIRDYIQRGRAVLRTVLRKLETELPQLKTERAEIERTPSQILVIPSAAEIRQLARETVKKLALESYEFAKLMRSLVTDFFVFPYRSCDGKDLVLRGTARLQLIQNRSIPRLAKIRWLRSGETN